MNDLEQRLSATFRAMSEQAPGPAGLKEGARRRYRRRQQTRLAAAAVVVVAALPVGAQLLDGPSTPAPAPAPAVTPSPSESPDTGRATEQERAYVGDTRLSDLGGITVHDVQFPVDVPGSAPPRGKRYGAVDLELCSVPVPGRTEGPTRFSLADFTLVERWIGSAYEEGPTYFSLSANRPRITVREPVLSEAQLSGLAEGSCARGWVSFALPRSTEIGTVGYQPWQGTPLSWRIER